MKKREHIKFMCAYWSVPAGTIARIEKDLENNQGVDLGNDSRQLKTRPKRFVNLRDVEYRNEVKP